MHWNWSVSSSLFSSLNLLVLHLLCFLQIILCCVLVIKILLCFNSRTSMLRDIVGISMFIHGISCHLRLPGTCGTHNQRPAINITDHNPSCWNSSLKGSVLFVFFLTSLPQKSKVQYFLSIYFSMFFSFQVYIYSVLSLLDFFINVSLQWNVFLKKVKRL